MDVSWSVVILQHALEGDPQVMVRLALPSSSESSIGALHNLVPNQDRK